MTIDARRLVGSGSGPAPAGKQVGVWGLVMLGGLAALVWVPLLRGAGSSTTSLPPQIAAPRETAIGPEPSSPYVRKDEPEMFKRWGSAGVARINRLRIDAAEKVAKSGKCDRVESADLDDRRSASKREPIVYVDCSDQRRFILTAADLHRPIMSETEKGSRWGRQDAIDVCTSALQRRLNVPASLSRDLLGTSAFQTETTGRWVVDFTFHARTGLGIKVPAAAHCVLKTDGRPEVTVGLR